MDATTKKIDHLNKANEISCNVDAGNCNRLSYANICGIFLYIYVWTPNFKAIRLRTDDTQGPERILTNYGSLVPLARKVQKTCQISKFYTFEIIERSSQNASDSIDFHLVVAGESMGM